MAVDEHTASGYHQHWDNKDTIVLSIDSDLLDQGLMGPDREDLMDIPDANDDERCWDEVRWTESLALSGNCTYCGSIPFDLLHIEKTIKQDRKKNGMKLDI